VKRQLQPIDVAAPDGDLLHGPAATGRDAVVHRALSRRNRVGAGRHARERESALVIEAHYLHGTFDRIER